MTEKTQAISPDSIIINDDESKKQHFLEQTLAKKDNLPSDLPNCLLSQYRFCTAGLG